MQLVKDTEGDELLTCTTNTDCDGVDCTTGLINAKVTILPCNDPPGIQLKITSAGAVQTDETVTDFTQISIGAIQGNVTVDQLDDAIGVEVCGCIHVHIHMYTLTYIQVYPQTGSALPYH